MSDTRPDKSQPAPGADKFAAAIGNKAARKLHARADNTPGLWFGLGMMGLIGWSIVVPTLLGAALGLWLDKHYAGEHSWTLALLMAGLTLGCFNAWHWLTKEAQTLDEDERRNDQH